MSNLRYNPIINRTTVKNLNKDKISKFFNEILNSEKEDENELGKNLLSLLKEYKDNRSKRRDGCFYNNATDIDEKNSNIYDQLQEVLDNSRHSSIKELELDAKKLIDFASHSSKWFTWGNPSHINALFAANENILSSSKENRLEESIIIKREKKKTQKNEKIFILNSNLIDELDMNKSSGSFKFCVNQDNSINISYNNNNITHDALTNSWNKKVKAAGIIKFNAETREVEFVHNYSGHYVPHAANAYYSFNKIAKVLGLDITKYESTIGVNSHQYRKALGYSYYPVMAIHKKRMPPESIYFAYRDSLFHTQKVYPGPRKVEAFRTIALEKIPTLSNSLKKILKSKKEWLLGGEEDIWEKRNSDKQREINEMKTFFTELGFENPEEMIQNLTP
jgi:hypothetical protein